jgi:hypothetical protein
MEIQSERGVMMKQTTLTRQSLLSADCALEHLSFIFIQGGGSMHNRFPWCKARQLGKEEKSQTQGQKFSRERKAASLADHSSHFSRAMTLFSGGKACRAAYEQCTT